jgi:hypothetical protein
VSRDHQRETLLQQLSGHWLGGLLVLSNMQPKTPQLLNWLISAYFKRPQRCWNRSGRKNGHKDQNTDHNHNGPSTKFDEPVKCALLHFGIHIAMFMLSHESLLRHNNFMLVTSTSAPCHHVKAAQGTNKAHFD